MTNDYRLLDVTPEDPFRLYTDTPAKWQQKSQTPQALPSVKSIQFSKEENQVAPRSVN